MNDRHRSYQSWGLNPGVSLQSLNPRYKPTSPCSCCSVSPHPLPAPHHEQFIAFLSWLNDFQCLLPMLKQDALCCPFSLSLFFSRILRILGNRILDWPHCKVANASPWIYPQGGQKGHISMFPGLEVCPEWGSK